MNPTGRFTTTRGDRANEQSRAAAMSKESDRRVERGSVSQTRGLPDIIPRLNAPIRCGDVPCVKRSGAASRHLLQPVAGKPTSDKEPPNVPAPPTAEGWGFRLLPAPRPPQARQRVKIESGAGVSAGVTVVPLAYAPEQSAPESIPA